MVTLLDGEQRMQHKTREAVVFRPLQPAMEEVNARFPDASVRFTADTVVPLDNLPVRLERKDGVHNLEGWRLVSFESKESGDQHVMLIKGDPTTPEPLLVRIHSSSIVNEIFHLEFSDDRLQLHTAMQRIYDAGRGVIVYVYQEGAGNGLASVVAQLALTNENIPMMQAFAELGIETDNRSFEYATDALKMLGVVAPVALMTRNKQKRTQMERAGFVLKPYRFAIRPDNPVARQYIGSKRNAGIY